MSARAGGSATKKKEDDYRSQLASNDEARRNEDECVIRTVEDAKEVRGFIEIDLEKIHLTKPSGRRRVMCCVVFVF